MSAPPAPDRSAVVAQRLAEAALIESEWTAMSYKDRAAWWLSAKWYGYQSAEAYRSGNDALPNESCRYGEPGFFIATRLAYFEAPAASPSPVVEATAEPPAASPSPVEATAEPPAPSPSPVEAPTTTEPVAEPIASDQTLIKNSVEGAKAAAVAQPNTNAPIKKKKKNKRGGSIGAGKTIEISLH
jgi:hypothetical protein